MPQAQFGEYRIVAKIGQGAMGVVYKAEDIALGRFVAIKMISAALLSDHRYRERFQREARSAAQLNHPNIVTVFEFEETGAQTYLVMELLEGTDLRDVIAARRLRRLDSRLAIVEQVLEGLAFAHSKGIVHRDLKPANIYVTPDGTVKLLDFGLARLGMSEMTRSGTVMGTPNYMSPEQVRAEPVDGRSDLFSVGAILYELLTNRKAFDADNMHATMFEVLERDPRPLGQAAPGLPKDVATIVRKALAKSPDHRYSSAGEMADAVRRARRDPATAQTTLVFSGDRGRGTAEPHADVASWATVPSPTVPTVALTPTLRAETTRTGSRRFAAAAPTLEYATEHATEHAGAEGTARPDPTVAEQTRVPSLSSAKRRVVFPAVAGLAVLVAVVVLLRLLVQPAASVAPAQPAPNPELALRAAVVVTRVELARVDLQNKDYAEAARQSESVLLLEPDNREARGIITDVREILASLEAAAQEARASLERGDMTTASHALSRVLAIDTHHPVAAEISKRLNRYFTLEARQAKSAADAVRIEAEHAGASGTEDFRLATRLVKDAETLVGRAAYAQATQKLVEASDRFGRARRSVQTANAQAAATEAAGRVAVLALPAAAERTPMTSTPTPSTSTTTAPTTTPLPTHAAADIPAAATESTEASTSSGSLRVTVKPWAVVSVDDSPYGRTPLKPISLAPGKHAVVFTHPGYQPLRRVVTIQSGEATTLTIDMRDEALRKR